MSKANTLAIETGALRLPVTRDGEAAGTLVLHPDDTAFLERFYALLPQLEQEKQTLSAALDAAQDTAAKLAAVNGLCAQLGGEIDTVFGAGTSALVFDGAPTLDTVRQFFEGVAAALGEARAPLLAKYTQAAPQPLA